MAVQGRNSSMGWPLGLQPLNLRVRLMEHFRWTDSAASIDLSSASSSDSSSDLDSESTISFFRDRSMTLGSLIGIRAEGSSDNRATNGRRNGAGMNRANRGRVMPRSLCCLLGCKTKHSNKRNSHRTRRFNAPSLGEFLALNRQRATVSDDGRVYLNIMYEDTDVINPLFENTPSPTLPSDSSNQELQSSNRGQLGPRCRTSLLSLIQLSL